MPISPFAITAFASRLRLCPETRPTSRRCRRRILSFIINDIDSQWVAASDWLSANELKSEEQQLDPQSIRRPKLYKLNERLNTLYAAVWFC